MTWVRLDDDFPNHPKILKAGAIAELIQVRALCYASHHLTNGFIPDAAVPALLLGLTSLAVDFAQVNGEVLAGNEALSVDWPSHMVFHDMWRKDSKLNGYWIHDYLDYQPSKKDVLKAREETRIRVSTWRQRNGPSNAVTNTVSNVVSNALVTLLPDPDPKYKSSKKNTRGPESLRPRPPGSDQHPDAFKKSSPVGNPHNGSDPTRPTAVDWIDALARASGISRDELERQIADERAKRTQS